MNASERQCALHPGVNAVGSCSSCGHPGCDICLTVQMGATVCSPCLRAQVSTRSVLASLKSTVASRLGRWVSLDFR